MAVDRTVLKMIAKECCRSLSYNDEERQFSFSLRPSLFDYWDDCKVELRLHQPDFLLDDFNVALDELENSQDSYDTITYNSLRDSDILNGEVMSLSFLEKEREMVLVKMKAGQYLDAATGKGMVFGSQFSFGAGNRVVTSDGSDLGVCRTITFRVPTVHSIVLSKQYLGNYYSHKIGESLWPLFEAGCEYLRSGGRQSISELLKLCEKMGVNSFTLLYILRGVCGAV